MNLEISMLDGNPSAVRVRGDIDLESVGKLREFIGLCPKGSPIVIDTSGVDFIDSSGLHVLVKLAANGDGYGGVVIRNPSRAVRRILEMALPDGIDGMVVEFDGAGPGAAHRFSGLVNSTFELHRVTRQLHMQAAALRRDARRERSRSGVIRA